MYFVTDHLGSVNQLVDPYGAPLTGERQLYKPWGEKRLNTSISLTRVGYTEQYDQAEIGLIFYQARWYDAYITRFTSPDSVIPDNYNSLDWDRYQYVRSNPVRYTDPTGHMVDDGCNTEGCAFDEEKRNKEHNPVIEKLISEHEKDSQFNLGGNTNSLAVIPTPNPPLGGVIIAGVVLTTGIVISEWLSFQAEVAVAGLMVAGTLTGPLAPLAEVALVGLEAILVGCSLTLIDIEVAYISYAVRIYENPTVKQEFEFLPPWGWTR